MLPHLLLPQGQKIYVLDLAELEKKKSEKVYHNKGSHQTIQKLTISPCGRILVVFDADRIGIWSTVDLAEVFQWSYLATKDLN